MKEREKDSRLAAADVDAKNRLPPPGTMSLPRYASVRLCRMAAREHRLMVACLDNWRAQIEKDVQLSGRCAMVRRIRVTASV